MSTVERERTGPRPPFTPEHERLRAEIRAFVEREVRPHVDAWEDARWFDSALFGKLAAAGYLGLRYPRAHGGRGGDHLDDAMLCEELARCGSGGVAAGIGAHVAIATPPVWTFGTEDQHRRYLAPAIAGEKIAALAITEPDAGSDVAAVRTRATRVDAGWVVNGAKTFITNGVRAHYYVAAVRTTDRGGHGGMSFLIIDRGPGVEATKLEKLGWHASDTALISFDDVFVPESNLLGRENEGFALIMANFQWERLQLALGAVAAMALAFEHTATLAAERPSSQSRRHRLAEVATTVATARSLTYEALRRFTAGQDVLDQVTMAKLATQRAAVDAVDACLQIHADLGMPAPELERGLRDARLGPIGGGTDEIMREILGKTLGL